VSESLQGRKPRVGEALAATGAGLWGFGVRLSCGERCWRRVFGLGESGGPVRDWRIDVAWRVGGAKGRDIGCADRLRRDGGSAGETCRRQAIICEGADRGGGHDESIPAGSAVKLRG
jgi:hypothetical protein